MIIQQISLVNRPTVPTSIDRPGLVNRPTVPTSIDRPGPFEGWGVRLGS
jgi:hypothetical protein